jgi:hypothetical protein
MHAFGQKILELILFLLDNAIHEFMSLPARQKASSLVSAICSINWDSCGNTLLPVADLGF